MTPESNTLHNYKVYFAVVKIRVWNIHERLKSFFSGRFVQSAHNTTADEKTKQGIFQVYRWQDKYEWTEYYLRLI